MRSPPLPSRVRRARRRGPSRRLCGESALAKPSSFHPTKTRGLCLGHHRGARRLITPFCGPLAALRQTRIVAQIFAGLQRAAPAASTHPVDLWLTDASPCLRAFITLPTFSFAFVFDGAHFLRQVPPG